jgi:beta-glucosidase
VVIAPALAPPPDIQIPDELTAAPESAVERSPKELKAFARVPLEPGETRAVRPEVPVSQLMYYDLIEGGVSSPLAYEVIVGRHARGKRALRARFRVV